MESLLQELSKILGIPVALTSIVIAVVVSVNLGLFFGLATGKSLGFIIGGTLGLASCIFIGFLPFWTLIVWIGGCLVILTYPEIKGRPRPVSYRERVEEIERELWEESGKRRN